MHEEIDDVLRFGREVRRLRRKRIDLGRRREQAFLFQAARSRRPVQRCRAETTLSQPAHKLQRSQQNEREPGNDVREREVWVSGKRGVEIRGGRP